MQEAAQCLVGEHDFSAFRASECQSRTPVRRLEGIAVRREGDRVLIDVTANAFLHHMVRNLVGTLIEIGRGRFEVSDLVAIREARDRSRAGPTAPARGLTLMSVEYPPAALDPGSPSG